MTLSKSAVKQQVPGFYRHRVGDVLITALYDGLITLAHSQFQGLEAEAIQGLINQNAQTPAGLASAITTYLIDDGSDLVLVDAGGDKWRGPAMGDMLENMAAAGYAPGDVSAILLTHLHYDHICGLNDSECRPVFPNAVVYASEAECRFWLTPQPQLILTKENRTFLHIATRAVAPYRNKRAFREFKDGEELRPGIKAMLTPGHTPGHTSFLVSSGQERILLWGDIVHAPALQLAHPQVSNDFDSDPAQATATRRSLFKKVVEENWLVGGGHLPFPGLGRLTENASGYGWAPLE